MPKGIVTRIGEKGFGFIRPDDGTQSVFFAAKAGRLFKPSVGDRVEFEFGKFDARRGKPTANYIEVIDDDDDKIETLYGEFDYEPFV